MVALNLLREIDTLWGHAIAEAAGVDGGAVPAGAAAKRRLLRRMGHHHRLSPGDDRGLGAMDAMRRRLLAARHAPSDRGPRRRAPADEELAAVLATAARLSEGLAGRLSRLAATGPLSPAAPLAALG